MATDTAAVELSAQSSSESAYRIVVDVPCVNPRLGFDGYVNALSHIVMESAPQFAVGIFGSWGSGKTTLMNALRTKLDQNWPRSDRITVGFSAWRYEKEPQLIVPLIDTIRDGVVEWSEQQPKRIADQARNGAVLLGRVAGALMAGLSLKVGVPGAVDLSFDANTALSTAKARDDKAKAERVPRSFYYASFQALSEAFNSIGTGPNRRIVVFIDDLDRCLPTGALEVMESMKLFFDLPGFVFVVGLDRAVVEWCVETRYQRERAPGTPTDGDAFTVKGADYINKIFQVPFSLPPVSVSDLDQFVESVIEDNNLEMSPEADHLRNIVRPHLDYVVGDLGVNPRRLKQYINSYVLQVSVKPSLIPDAVLAIQTITYRDDWTVVRNALYTDRDLLLTALAQPDMTQIRGALADLDPEYLRIPDSFFEYIAPGLAAPDGPGRPLLTCGPTIQEYLYSGEATLSTVNTSFVTIIPMVGKLRSLLRLAIAEDGTPMLLICRNSRSCLTWCSHMWRQCQERSANWFWHRSKRSFSPWAGWIWPQQRPTANAMRFARRLRNELRRPVRICSERTTLAERRPSDQTCPAPT